ncbi:MAG TPA: hypothetical protein VFY23_04990 [Candidatus Limnocylindrales bacterium]|nr:hypothetical protein [Candidatus Limnocylindrales bacterium]
MKKRVLAGILWFFAAWYGWCIFASFAGLSDVAGPLLGLAAGLLFAVDPLNRIWAAPRPATQRMDAPAAAKLA